LGEYIEAFGAEARLVCGTEEVLPRRVRAVTYDSREAGEGSLFFCKGAHFSADYALAAAKRGAVGYVFDEKSDPTALLAEAGYADLPGIFVPDIRPAISQAAALYYKGLRENLTIIGFTGTKGKSTTTYYSRAILDAWMKREGRPASAVLSGIENYDGVVCEESHLTTQEVFELYKHFRNAVSSGITHLTMEVSSQALKYGRTRGLGFDVAGFLNIGEDHISDIEHADLEDYFTSKLKIFEGSRFACVNLGADEAARVLKAAGAAQQTITFGQQEAADVYGYATVPTDAGVAFRVRTRDWDAPFYISMGGLFNVDNALAAIASAHALGAPVEAIQEGLAQAKASGRMELFAGPDGKTILVDYAHNKMSYEALFSSVAEEYPSRPVITLFGCPGGKAQARRRELSEIAAPASEAVYVTEEDPGEEPPEKIAAEILGYIKEAGGHGIDIADRTEAITRAITEAPAGAVVLVLGKGRETRQKRGTAYVPVESDVQIVQRVITS
jgi:UDP-N-acetylmuramoyl-L-alanyl-D-glutamate--2,6-diaminopimelate ligase